ncbi:phosphatase PAP2 family protein [Neolewinella aurantiaca]|uniref:Phosphatase PAP2 family protein n=1 Tax=Neolewinella aurantiaca TaxID=2602767 RepID=A0A5C7FBH9_9BACT|nr:phosphatase PAP2 family protein [Neolewinella aurantiaca]TXF88218.1 phosphatase PAP2 family protein [Neolewinella aurantiaca]
MHHTDAWRQFIRLFFLVFLAGLAVALFTEKGAVVLWMTEHRTPVANTAFRVITFLGDGIMVALVCLLALLIRYKYTLTLILIGLGQLLISAFLKRTVFGNHPRPLAYFQEIDPLWLVEGVQVHTNYAFPSGHTITAFSLCFFCALMFDRRWITFSMVVLATLIGISRVYLFQHFIEDVVAGSMAGVIITGGIYYAMAGWALFWENQKLQRSVVGEWF